MYGRVERSTRKAVISALFAARDEEGLIRIAQAEKDPELRRDVLSRLRLLGTPGAKAFLDKQPK
jgi:hypothetical protein